MDFLLCRIICQSNNYYRCKQLDFPVCLLCIKWQKCSLVEKYISCFITFLEIFQFRFNDAIVSTSTKVVTEKTFTVSTTTRRLWDLSHVSLISILTGPVNQTSVFSTYGQINEPAKSINHQTPTTNQLILLKVVTRHM